MSKQEPTDNELSSSIQRWQKSFEARAAAEEAVETRPPAKIVQFPLPFPEDAPPVSNVIARSALFAAIRSKDRRQMHKEVVASQEGVEISFTGEQLNQDDHDNFMQLVKLASGRPLGHTVIVPANAILRTLGRSTGKSQHDQLRADMDRLVTGTVTIRSNGIANISATWSTMRCKIPVSPYTSGIGPNRLNPRLVTLFAPSRYTLNNWQTRQMLGQKDLAAGCNFGSKAMRRILPWAWRRSASGAAAQTARCGSFRQQLREALNGLKEAAVIHDWAIDAGDLVHVVRTPSDSQIAHVLKKRTRKKADSAASGTEETSQNAPAMAANSVR